MSKDWQVWLNINVDIHSNFLLNSRNKCIGKNIVFNGNPEILFISDNISIIGYGKIYNEPELWKILNIPHYINIENKNNHSLRIIVELYKKYGFEDMLELIEGDYSFLLLDYNIHGDESWLYVVKDPFGIYPLYYYENLNNHPKKVQFEIEMKYYCFLHRNILIITNINLFYLDIIKNSVIVIKYQQYGNVIIVQVYFINYHFVVYIMIQIIITPLNINTNKSKWQ